jgi:hypothetical protein
MKKSKLFLAAFFMLFAKAVFAQPMANDNFDRTVATGWGNATDGQTWTQQAPPIATIDNFFSVDESTGGIIMPYGANNYTVTLGTQTASDVEAVIRATTQFKKPDGVSNTDANFGVGMCVNAGATQLYKAHIQPDGLHLQKRYGNSGTDVPGCPVVLDPPPQNDRNYFIRLRKVGNVISATCWLEDSTEAKSFGITYTDTLQLKGTGVLPAGMVGVRGTMNNALNIVYSKFTAVDLLPSGGTGVATSPVATPKTFALNQNYPNPFNPSTNFTYTVGKQGFVSLKVYNVLGQEVASLVNEVKQAGSYPATWNAAGFGSGIYFCKLQSGSFMETKKMILMK